MARRIRRNSMEQLELYDLDNIKTISLTCQVPPPLPPPRKVRRHVPIKNTFERYRFLCDTQRHKTDPVYAATPMFTTIPRSTHVHQHRQLLGSRIPSEIIKPAPPATPSTPKSTEPESAEVDDDKKEEEEEEDEDSDDDDNQKSEESESDNDNQPESSSTSPSSNSSDDSFLEDDDDKRGIVERMFNRHKKK